MEKQNMQTGIYRHYKGKLYHLIGGARHSESHEEMVVYRALYGNYGIWVRPYSMFFEEVVTDGQKILRFTFLHSADQAPEIL